MSILRIPITLILMLAPAQQANLSDVKRAVTSHAQACGFDTRVATRSIPHPAPELNTVYNRFIFLFYLFKYASNHHLTRARAYHFIGLLDGRYLFGQSQIAQGAPGYSFGSGGDAETTAVIALHEIGHTLGLSHRAGTLMAEDAIARTWQGELLCFDAEQVRVIARSLRRARFGKSRARCSRACK